MVASLAALLTPPHVIAGWPNPTPGSTRVLAISPDGNDSNPGTRAEPFRTISRAAEAAEPGTTVVVTAGTYVGSFRTAASGTASAPITYVAEPTWGARLVGDGTADTVWRNDGDHVEIRGFEISGAAIDGLVNSGSFVRIAENKVSGFANGNCITTARSGYTLHDIDVIANVAHGCGGSALDHGIYVSHPGGTVANNIAVRNGEYGIEESGATGPNNLYLHNIVFANAEGGLDLDTGRESGTIMRDPMFVGDLLDVTSDYRLQAASPGVDAGTPDGAPATDIKGTPRPQGRGVDIGPYER